MRKLLFLDYDGILHSNCCPEAERFYVAPQLWECLRGEAPRVEVVISSSWRFHYDLGELRSLFPEDLRRPGHGHDRRRRHR